MHLGRPKCVTLCVQIPMEIIAIFQQLIEDFNYIFTQIVYLLKICSYLLIYILSYAGDNKGYAMLSGKSILISLEI